MSLADTDVLINYLNGQGPGRELLEAEMARKTLRTSVISVFEILAGTRTPRERAGALDLLSLVPAFPLFRSAAGRAAEVDRELRAQGIRLATADTLIAGVALARGLPLITRNQRHFERVRGLELLTLK